MNGILSHAEVADDPLAAAIHRREQAVLADLPEVLRALPRDELALKSFNLVGLDALGQIRQQVLATKGKGLDEQGRALLEAAALQSDLRRAGIEPWAWVVNASVAAASVSSPLLRRRAANELSEIEAVATQHAARYAVVPLLQDEPIGVQRLRELTGTAITV